MKLLAFSDIGNSRAQNEDNYLIPSPTTDVLIRPISEKVTFSKALLPTGAFCCVVSDGMGGHAFGEVASFRTVKYVEEHYDALLHAELSEEALINFVAALNESVYSFSLKRREYFGMGATLCGLVANKSSIYCFNVGDSRAYLLRNNILQQISVDHTEGTRLRRMNLLTAEEAQEFPLRKALYKYIGQSTPLIPDIFLIEQSDTASTFLLCTDGLTDVLQDYEIEKILNEEQLSLEEKGNCLVDNAIQRKKGSGDNVTLILVQM